MSLPKSKDLISMTIVETPNETQNTTMQNHISGNNSLQQTFNRFGTKETKVAHDSKGGNDTYVQLEETLSKVKRSEKKASKIQFDSRGSI